MIITDLPSDILINIIDNYLTLLDSYHFCITCKSIYNYYELPGFEMIIGLNLDQENEEFKISRRSLKRKYSATKKNLKKTREIIDVFKKGLFNKQNLREINFDDNLKLDLRKLINKLRCVIEFEDYNDELSLFPNFYTGNVLKIREIQTILRDSNCTNLGTITEKIKPIRSRGYIMSIRNREKKREKFHVKEIDYDKSSMVFFTQTCLLTNPLDKFDWYSITENSLIENIKYKHDCNLLEIDDNSRTNVYVNRFPFQVSNMKRKFDDQSLYERIFVYNYNTSCGTRAYCILLSILYTGSNIILECYKLNDKTELYWKVKISYQLKSLKLPLDQRINVQISDNIIIVPINIENFKIYWLVFDLKTGQYLGKYIHTLLSYININNENENDNYSHSDLKSREFNSNLSQIYLHGPSVFIKRDIYRHSFGNFPDYLSRIQILSMPLDSFLSHLNNEVDIHFTVEILKMPSNLNSNHLEVETSCNHKAKFKSAFGTSFSTKPVLDWKILLETPVSSEDGVFYVDHRRQPRFMKKLLGTQFYLWNNRIILFLKYNIVGRHDVQWNFGRITQLQESSFSRYLFLFDMETRKRKYIDLGDFKWNEDTEEDDLLMIDEKFNFTLFTDSCIKTSL